MDNTAASEKNTPMGYREVSLSTATVREIRSLSDESLAEQILRCVDLADNRKAGASVRAYHHEALAEQIRRFESPGRSAAA